MKGIRILWIGIIWIGTLLPLKAQHSMILLRGNAIPLREAIRQIERESTYLFLYNESRIDMSRRVRLDVASADIRQVLDQLCQAAHIRYELLGEQVLLFPTLSPDPQSAMLRPINGYVCDEQGAPIEFATVFDRQMNQGVLTDEEGYFSLMAADSAYLEIAHVSYQSQEIAVGPTDRDLRLQLRAALFHLEEVVAIGYGTIARRELTSAVGHISSSNFLSGKSNNPIQAIKGQIAGLSISGASSADINAEPDLQIRGIGSILAGNTPLIVVDGVPGVSLNSLSQTEIASISVLKDGSSAAIYGSNGANGVILITTKKSKGSDPLQATYNSYLSATQEYHRPRILSPEQFVEKGRDSDMGYRTNWYDALVRPVAWEHNHDLSLQNGWQSGSFRASANFRDGQGLDVVSSRKEYALRTAINQKLLSDHLDLTFSLSYKQRDASLGNHTAFRYALELNPTAPIFRNEEKGLYFYPPGFERDNAVAALKEEIKEQQSQYLTGSLHLRANWNDHLYSNVMLAENREQIETGTY